MKLGLGGAQFGLQYGATNQTGKTAPEEVGAILDFAQRSDIHLIDTAAAYGDSESVLGNRSESKPFRIVSKIPALNQSAPDLETTLQGSLKRLNRSRLDALLLHRVDDLFEPQGAETYRQLVALKTEGLVSKIGVSIYSGEQMRKCLQDFDIDIVQLPMNILDQRLIESGVINALKSRRIEIHVRSIFLQGLLAVSPVGLPAAVEPGRQHLLKLFQTAAELKVSVRALALDFIRRSGVDYGIVGVENKDQLREVLKDFETSIPSGFHHPDWAWRGNESVINPMLWKN